MTSSEQLQEIELRLTALERISAAPKSPPRATWETSVALVAGVVGVFCAFRGLGIPNHPYQVAIAGAVTMMGYHSRRLALPQRPYEWLLMPLNLAAFIFIAKIFIGGGVRQPFSWLQYPSMQLIAPTEKWFSVFPKATVAWLPSELSLWSIDLTVVQSFIALLCAFGSLIRFQPFASLCGLLLVIFSLPALVEFNWPWVFPALLLCGMSFYLQVGKRT